MLSLKEILTRTAVRFLVEVEIVEQPLKKRKTWSVDWETNPKNYIVLARARTQSIVGRRCWFRSIDNRVNEVAFHLLVTIRKVQFPVVLPLLQPKVSEPRGVFSFCSSQAPTISTIGVSSVDYNYCCGWVTSCSSHHSWIIRRKNGWRMQNWSGL